jgi:mannosyltransferase OCH1-like enzyme
LIPKKLHYCWFGGGPKSELMQSCMRTWQEVLPDFEIKEWNESNSPLESDYARRACAEGAWAFLADYVRLHALYMEGGVYLDVDVEVIHSLAPLLDNRCFLGFQLREENTDWVGVSVIGSVSGHPFLKKWMERTLAAFGETGRFTRAPLLVTAVLKEMGLSRYGPQSVEDVTLYPIESFYPYSWFEPFRPEVVTPDTYCVHRWAGSWLEPPPLPVQILLFLRNLFPPPR